MMALFGVKRKKDGAPNDKNCPPQKDIPSAKLDLHNHSPHPSPPPSQQQPPQQQQQQLPPNQLQSQSQSQSQSHSHSHSHSQSQNQMLSRQLPSYPNPPVQLSGVLPNPYSNSSPLQPTIHQNIPSPPQIQHSKHPPPNPSTVIYPWSHRRLGLLPPAPFPADPPPDPNSSLHLRPSPPPFPRYGHSVNAMGTASGSGDLYIFAGLVKDQVKNDLYVLNIASAPLSASPTTAPLHNQILTVGQVETRGEVPLSRVGHASVGVGNVLIVWGGDTKTREEDRQDDGLYLLNLSTREWTRVKVSGPCPEGRYGHSAAIVGSKFYIFGGQTDNGGFMNDLWSFDLHKLKSGAPRWQRADLPPNAPVPSRRTGHTVVTHAESIYVFGGTDGQYHYNDTWKFDTSSGSWKELDCIGYIPLPREGHAATLVDDVMYVLGGRGVDGKDLDDLAAFKISNQRWYMFQNMGPAPAGRSGHSMASWQGKVYVLGGESYTSARPDDPSIVHVLDTGKIKYPPDPSASARQQVQVPSKKTSNVSLNGQSASTQGWPNGTQAPAAPGMRTLGSGGASAEPVGPKEVAMAERAIKRSTTGPGPSAAVPVRPRRQDDPPGATGAPNLMNRRTIGSSTPRTMSPQGQMASMMADANGRRSMSPPVTAVHTRNSSVDASHIGPSNLGPGVKPARPSGPAHGYTNSIGSQIQANRQTGSPVPGNPQARQSGSPVPRRISAEISRMMNGGTPPATGPRATQDPAPASQQHQQRGQVTSQTDQELEKKNGWMRAALAMAVKQGFMVPPPAEEEGDDEMADERAWLQKFEEGGEGTKDKGMKRLVEALVQLKRELARAKGQMADQSKSLDERFVQVRRTKTAAIEEASFYRVKLAAYEAGSVSEINKLERERISGLEQRLSEVVGCKARLERQVGALVGEVEQERERREVAEESATKGAERAAQIEKLHERTMLDYEELLCKTRGMDAGASAVAERHNVLDAAHRTLEAELEDCRERLRTAEASNQQYLLTLEHVQKTMSATVLRAEETTRFWEQTKDELAAQRQATMELNRQLEARRAEVGSAEARAGEVEQMLRTVEEENAALRALNQEGMTELVEAARTMATVSTRSGEAVSKEKDVEAQEERGVKTDEQSKAKLETVLVELSEVRMRNNGLAKELVSSKVELGELRAKVAGLVHESHKMRTQMASKEAELKDKVRLVEASEVKASVLKNLMSEHGLLAGDDEMMAGSRSFESGGGEGAGMEQLVKRMEELEGQLEQRARAQRAAEHQAENTQRSMVQAEERYREAHRKHEAAAEEIAGLVEEVQRLRSGGASSVSPASVEGQGKVEEELQALQERHRTLEQTHIKAVQYVKGTEKMLRRMKEELSKYKERTEALEAELNSVRGGGGGSGSGSEGKIAIEMRQQMAELTSQLESLRHSSRQSSLENEELQRRMGQLQADYSKERRMIELSRIAEVEGIRDQFERVEKKNEGLRKEIGEVWEQNKKLIEQIESNGNGNNNNNNNNGAPSGAASGVGASGGASGVGVGGSVGGSGGQKEMEWLKKENLDLQNRCRDAEAKISLLLDHMENQSEV